MRIHALGHLEHRCLSGPTDRAEIVHSTAQAPRFEERGKKGA
jgi:hypothetical protein